MATTSQGAKIHQMLSSLWSSGCQGETGWLLMAFQEKFWGFAGHSRQSQAAAKGKRRSVIRDHGLWSHFKKLPLRWLS